MTPAELERLKRQFPPSHFRRALGQLVATSCGEEERAEEDERLFQEWVADYNLRHKSRSRFASYRRPR